VCITKVLLCWLKFCTSLVIPKIPSTRLCRNLLHRPVCRNLLRRLICKDAGFITGANTCFGTEQAACMETYWSYMPELVPRTEQAVNIQKSTGPTCQSSSTPIHTNLYRPIQMQAFVQHGYELWDRAGSLVVWKPTKATCQSLSPRSPRTEQAVTYRSLLELHASTCPNVVPVPMKGWLFGPYVAPEF
jgi:hypothetical protein